MPRNHSRGIGQHQQAITQGAQDLPTIAPGKIGSPDRSGKESVAGEQQVLLREEETDAAWSVPGVCNTSAGREARPTAKPSSALASGGATSGVGTPSQPACISIMLSRPRSCWFINTGAPVSFLQQGRSADMVDMRMSDDNLAQGQAMLLQPGENLRNVVSGVDDDGFVRDLVAQDGAIAVQRTDGKGLKDHCLILGDSL